MVLVRDRRSGILSHRSANVHPRDGRQTSLRVKVTVASLLGFFVSAFLITTPVDGTKIFGC